MYQLDQVTVVDLVGKTISCIDVEPVRVGLIHSCQKAG